MGLSRALMPLAFLVASAHGDPSKPAVSVCPAPIGAMTGAPLHEGKSYDVVHEIADPLAADGKIMLLRDKGDGTKRVAPFEEGFLKELLKRFPGEMAALGMAPTPGGLVSCPEGPGLNVRIPKAFAKNGVKTYVDRSPEGATHLEMARRWAKKETPVSENGRDAKGQSLRFHDTFVHVLGYAMIPKELVDVSSRNMKLLLEIYDHPSLEEFPKVRQRVEEIITSIISKDLELVSASMPYQILHPDAENLAGTLFHLGHSGAESVRLALDRHNVPSEVRKELAPLLDAMTSVGDKEIDEISAKHLRTSAGWK